MSHSDPNPPAHQRVGDDHPALAGHFPGHPVVPGVLLLDRVVRHVAALHPEAGAVTGFRGVKFHAPLGPECDFRIELETTEGRESFRFCVVSGTTLIAQGTGLW